MKLQAIIKKCSYSIYWYVNFIGSTVEIEYIEDNDIFPLTKRSNDKYILYGVKNTTGLGVYKRDIKIITREDKLKRIIK